jgi:hypothetical protein
MKRFKELTEELLNEGGEMYPADEMTMKEIKIACYAAQNILERLENGSMIQRWQISAIVKASEELASVYTSMSADEVDDEEWDDMEEEEPMYVGFEYPSMYGEAVELDEAKWKETPTPKFKTLLNKHGLHYSGDKTKEGHTEFSSKDGRFVGVSGQSGKWHSNDKSGSLYDDSLEKHLKGMNEETDYEVDVEGLPKMYVKADNPSQVKNNLRKVVKNPEMIRGVERVAKATLQKIFRDKAAGKDEVAEEVELDEASQKKLDRAMSIINARITKPGQPPKHPSYHSAPEDIKAAAKNLAKNMKEEVELDEASDLRITKVYNKFPKKATYAVHSPDRKYYKEFDSMEKAKAHHAEKTGK